MHLKVSRCGAHLVQNMTGQPVNLSSSQRSTYVQRLAIILSSTLSVIALLTWAEKRIHRSAHRFDPLLALRDSGRHIWASEHADEYIDRLREGWE
jgi:hypothetical protein